MLAMHYLVLADDLTGACDSAVQFCLRGVSTVVHTDYIVAPDRSVQVHAFNAETRGLDPQTAEIRIREIAGRTSGLRSLPHLVFKKIDSLLRGNPGHEIRVALDTFSCEFAVITPAFPDMGRSVRRGKLHVHGDPTWEPISVRDLLCSQGLEDCVHMNAESLRHSLDQNHSYLSFDAVCPADLKAIAAEVLRSERRVLWVGSGGLAAALASVLFPGEAKAVHHAPTAKPVLFCVGSIDPVTCGQLDVLQKERAGSFEMLRLPWEMTSPALRASLEGKQFSVAAILLSGGDTAAHVCRALDVSTIRLQGEVLRGVPWGILEGGPFDGLPMVTKSGAFGQPDALIRVADYFTCPQI